MTSHELDKLVPLRLWCKNKFKYLKIPQWFLLTANDDPNDKGWLIAVGGSKKKFFHNGVEWLIPERRLMSDTLMFEGDVCELLDRFIKEQLQDDDA